MVEEGEVILSKELEPQKMVKIAKGAQKKSLSKGVITKKASDRRPKVQI